MEKQSRKNQGDAAISEFKETIRIDPDNAGAHFNLGIAYGGQGNELDNLDAEVAEYKEAIRINPDHADAHYALGWANKEQGKYVKIGQASSEGRK